MTTKQFLNIVLGWPAMVIYLILAGITSYFSNIASWIFTGLFGGIVLFKFFFIGVPDFIRYLRTPKGN